MITITGGDSGNLLYYVENKKCNLFVIDVIKREESLMNMRIALYVMASAITIILFL